MAVGGPASTVVAVGARGRLRQMAQSVPSGRQVRASTSDPCLPQQRLTQHSVDLSVHQKRRSVVLISLTLELDVEHVYVVRDPEQRLCVNRDPAGTRWQRSHIREYLAAPSDTRIILQFLAHKPFTPSAPT